MLQSQSHGIRRGHLLSAVSTKNHIHRVEIRVSEKDTTVRAFEHFTVETWNWRWPLALTCCATISLQRVSLQRLSQRAYLVHLALQGHGPVLDSLLLRHLVVEHTLQLLEPPRARLKPHLCCVQGLWF